MELKITTRQKAFIDARCDEVLFGGAAGGGKSYAQMIDALIFALSYPGSRQLILRRTYPELEKSLIRVAQSMYPRSIFKYNASKYRGEFINGSVLEFGQCGSEDDVYKYQSAEYDVLRIDELTHFTEFMYRYLLSRIRGVNGYPKMAKCSTNPGGVGHSWVKTRFIDIGPADTVHKVDGSSRIFIPAKVQDNKFLMERDPEYLNRLEQLPEREKRALLKGDWDIFEGQYFSEWDRELHVVEPFPIPDSWERFLALDYGLDMLAVYWIAIDGAGGAWVYREFCRPDLIVSDAAAKIASLPDLPPICYGPPDLWNRRQDTGKSAAQIFAENGVELIRVQNGRVNGWLELKEWLKPRLNEFGELKPRLRVFDTCTELIRTLPALTHDKTNPSDAAREPHDLTHSPDALRYFVSGRPGVRSKGEDRFQIQVEDFLNFGTGGESI